VSCRVGVGSPEREERTTGFLGLDVECRSESDVHISVVLKPVAERGTEASLGRHLFLEQKVRAADSNGSIALVRGGSEVDLEHDVLKNLSRAHAVTEKQDAYGYCEDCLHGSASDIKFRSLRSG
jgi:hypothetical protein